MIVIGDRELDVFEWLGCNVMVKSNMQVQDGRGNRGMRLQTYFCRELVGLVRGVVGVLACGWGRLFRGWAAEVWLAGGFPRET